ncbi:DUF5677 domain-containing protein [Streptomyces sp. XD-27]|uniref:DUF5677 domain-containing protein n=1 Tax=Streptomyces sp. XD-27 TaxID=3062779 RepID=UPI0026F44CBE|nr:DUF5677 domain-containing protein [Streptomyces sp. XD-27]WKX70045.1 DUF5677 domain-containing protein [Streptomyces sp. XD-27]
MRNLLSKGSRVESDDFFAESLLEVAMRHIESGADPQRMEEVLAEAIPRLVDKFGPDIASRIIKSKKALRVNMRYEARFDKRLQRRWRRALDLCFITMSCAHELGQEVSLGERENVSPIQANQSEALAGLHAAACRGALEVFTLISHGHPKGAMARCRTLHEFAVIATVIGDSARDPEHEDLAERFLDHEIVTLRREAHQFQAVHEVLGMEPLEESYLEELEGRYADMLNKYGPDFSRVYGWAKKFVPDDNFRALEEKASLGHLRPYYQWASSEVHCGARGFFQNFINYRGALLRDAGKTNVGLAEPASMALNSLIQVTVALLTAGKPNGAGLKDLICMRALMELNDACAIAFVDAQADIDRDESKIMDRLARD